MFGVKKWENGKTRMVDTFSGPQKIPISQIISKSSQKKWEAGKNGKKNGKNFFRNFRSNTHTFVTKFPFFVDPFDTSQEEKRCPLH